MKRYLIPFALLATSALAHEAKPETKFFQDEIQKNPMIQNVLVWCSLIGLDKEEACKAEMYNGDSLNDIRLKAATKCVDKSGMQYRVAFDKYFESSHKDQSLVADPDFRGRNHLYPAVGKKGTPWEKEHYYFHTALERQTAAFKLGDEFVARAKTLYEGMNNSEKSTGQVKASVQGDVAILKILSEISGTHESVATKPALAPEVLEKIQKQGQDYGRSNPLAAGVSPSGVCFVGGDCTQDDRKFPESQLISEVNRDLVPKQQGSEPKVVVIEVPAGELHPKDPFAPFKSETATGGMETGTKDTMVLKEVEAPKEVETPKAKDPKEKPDSTGVAHEAYVENMNDCVHREEENLYNEMGSKSIDPEAKTKEQRQEEAERDLANGSCDDTFFGTKYCQSWAKERAESKAEGEQEHSESERQAAIDNLQNGLCDSVVLGDSFCRVYFEEMASTKAEENLEETILSDEYIPEVTPVVSEGIAGTLGPNDSTVPVTNE